ncbi:MAG: peptidase, partial [[Bacteroides] pectinophilus]|nr:peptidase [[Bacteroides] pectinophilus]
MNCSQIITSENYYDYIAAYTPYLYNMLSYTPGVCVNNIDDEWLVIHYKGDGNTGVSTSGYIEIPKLFTLTDTSSIDASGITQVHNQPVLNLLGRGVLIGFIDTGIDYLNPIFQYARGLSKIDAIWDQTIQSPDSDLTDNPYKYGTVYTNSKINDAIAASLAGDDPYVVVPSKDDNGHGTFIAG